MKAVENREGKKSLVLRCAMSGVIGTAVTAVLMLVPAILISHGTITAKLSDSLTLLCMIIGGIASGVVMKSHAPGGAVPRGAIGGLCVALVMALVVAMRGAGAGFDAFSLKLLICGVVGGVFGGTLKSGKNRPRRKKHKK